MWYVQVPNEASQLVSQLSNHTQAHVAVRGCSDPRVPPFCNLGAVWRNSLLWKATDHLV